MGRAILVVDDDRRVVQALSRQLRAYRPCVGALSGAQAAEMLSAQALGFCGVVLDVAMETPFAGLELLERFRERHRSEPAMILTGQLSAQVVAHADSLRARLIIKGSLRGRLPSFGMACVAADITAGLEGDEPVREAVLDFAKERALSEGEIEVLVGALEGHRAAWFSDEGKLPLPTYKWRVTSLLNKSGHDSIDEVVRCVLLDAVRRACSPPAL